MTETPLDSFKTQIRLLGSAVFGAYPDTSVIAAEAPHLLTWDLTAKDLATWRVSHGDEPYRPVKPHAALPYVADHALRGHIEWAPL